MTSARIELRISAGTGPAGARRFVAQLLVTIGRELAARGLVVELIAIDGEREAPRAAVVAVFGRSAAVDAAVREHVGTHRTIETSARRGTRRRWFASITVVPTATVQAPTSPIALEVRYVRSRGPGGQNVNRRATAVQLRDPRTGVQVRCDEHRTQARNRAAAMRRVQALATGAARADVDGQRRAAWSAQRQLTGRACVRHWRTDRDGALVPEAGDDVSGSDRRPRRRPT